MLLGLCYQISLVQHTILHRIFLQYCDTLVDPVLAQQWGHTACMWTAAACHHGSLYSIGLFCCSQDARMLQHLHPARAPRCVITALFACPLIMPMVY